MVKEENKITEITQVYISKHMFNRENQVIFFMLF